jgi:hypothetical protein
VHSDEAPGLSEILRLQAKLLDTAVLDRDMPVSASLAALLVDTAVHLVTRSVEERRLGWDGVSVLLSRFADAMRRWRYDTDGDHPIKWPITSERDVQNIIWIMLRPVFNDLVDEEALRKVGHSTYRADFAIPSLGLLIEVKYARKATDFKGIEKEIFEDYVAYLTEDGPYRKMTVFIYDESASVQEHGTTRNALLKLPNVTEVIIACRPSHLPVPERPPLPPRRGPRPSS